MDSPLEPRKSVSNGIEYGYREGEVCETLNKRIADLIVYNGAFIVFLDDDCFVQWCISGAIEEPPQFNGIMNRVSFLETISASHFPPRDPSGNADGQLRQFRRLLGEAVARAFSGDGDSAISMLDHAEALLRDRSEERARFWYLSAAGTASLVPAVVGLFLWTFRHGAQEALGSSGFEVMLGACIGGVGALISTVMGVRKVNLNASAGPAIHWVEGVARVTVGVAGALLVALAIKGNFVLGMLNLKKDGGTCLACILTVCLVAGASERMVPNLIRQVETNGGTETNSGSK